MSRPEPVLLRPDNFTPLTRTPWGGTRLVRKYKRAWLATDYADAIGESWEVSVGPEYPARLEDGSLLSDYIARDPEAVLGEGARRGDGSALLVKLIDADEPLSLQIHPSDDYAGLASDECGKPESWYVLDREPGAGLYLGFRSGVAEQDVRRALAGGRSLEPLLRFVPVEPGDFFLIDAGTPHAIGAGLTLVEPQHVSAGRRGVTYRYWDWDRRYDARGRPDPNGSARPLHVEHALRVTAWERVRADDFVDRIRVRAGVARREGEARYTPLAGEQALASEFLRVGRLEGTGAEALPSLARMQAITVLAGTVRVGAITIERGRSAVVPACLAGSEVALEEAHALVSAVP